MQAGKLRHRLKLQKNTPTRGTAGGLVDVWSDITEACGSIMPLSGTELNSARQLSAQVTHLVTLRYRSDITAPVAKHRILFGARIFDIDVVTNPDERKRSWELLCTERIPA